MHSTRHTSLASIITALLLTLPAIATSEDTQATSPGVTEAVKEQAGKAWTSTKETLSKTADWTEEKTTKGVEVVTEGTVRAADWAGEKGKQGLEATREGAGEVWDGTKSAVGGALNWTGDKAKQAAEALTPDEPAPSDAK